MASSTVGSAESLRRQDYFATTHWSVVLRAGQQDSTRAGMALESLCRSYWYPLYAYVRRRGYSPHDAQDLTQSFFASLLERQSLATVDPERGRFRSFLLGAMNNFLATEWAKKQTQKRGGGKQILSLDLAAAEERFDLEPADPATLDRTFDREWAAALLENVLSKLEEEFATQEKAELFAVMKQTLTGPRESQPYAALAAKVGMNEGALKTAVHRLRKRYRTLLQEEISNTVASTEEVEAEMRYLLTVLASR